MTIAKLAKRKVVVADPDMTVYEVASLMKSNNIGYLVVAERGRPAGIITDRDIIVKIVASDVNPNEVSAADIMTRDLLSLNEYQPIQESLEMMCAKGVRRAPIVNDAGALVGVVSTDDLALLMADEMECYGKLIRKQITNLRPK